MKSFCLVVLVWGLGVGVALGEPAAEVAAGAYDARAVSMIETRLLRPLARAESRRSPFSRGEPGPEARRVRVLDRELQRDARGKRFVRFAVDARWDEGETWEQGELRGCAYLYARRVYVEVGEGEHLPARAVLGRGGDIRDDVCQPSPPSAVDQVAGLGSASR